MRKFHGINLMKTDTCECDVCKKKYSDMFFYYYGNDDEVQYICLDCLYDEDRKEWNDQMDWHNFNRHLELKEPFDIESRNIKDLWG